MSPSFFIACDFLHWAVCYSCIISLTLPELSRALRKSLNCMYFNFFQSRILSAKFDSQVTCALAASVMLPMRL